jgi:hypothetical protein
MLCIILISLILHFPQFYIYFRWPLKKCKIMVSLSLVSISVTSFVYRL